MEKVKRIGKWVGVTALFVWLAIQVISTTAVSFMAAAPPQEGNTMVTTVSFAEVLWPIGYRVTCSHHLREYTKKILPEFPIEFQTVRTSYFLWSTTECVGLPEVGMARCELIKAL